MSKKRILLVDDEPDAVATVEFVLIGSGYQVFVAKNGIEALEQARWEKPDLVIMDIMMPEMDGLEACRHFKTDSSLKSIPIIMLTARGQVRDINDAFAFGAYSYIIKPFDLMDLEERIEKILYKTRSKSK